MKTATLTVALAATVLTVAPAARTAELPILYFLGADIDGARSDGAALFTWDAEGWVGGDRDKLVLKSEGEIHDGRTEQAEARLLWRRPVAEFWDVEAGIRRDWRPTPLGYATLGLSGMLPYFVETELAAFVSQDGDASLRLEHHLDLPLTQRLFLEPHVEFELFAQEVPEREVGAGLASVEGGLRLRYEITRKFAPYVDAVYERTFGETARIARAAGEDVGEATLRLGVSVWF